MWSDDFLDRHRAEMIRSLQALLRIPSVGLAPAPGCPFGPDCAAALAYVLDLAAAHGLRVYNADGYAGHVEWGEGEDYIAVLAHLDVVPAGDGWTYPPFAGEIHDGVIYGRGAVDDKGPALSALWGLIALKEAGLHPKRKIRIIFGLDEESGWQCMKHYFAKQPFPIGGFSPDADFPLIYAEKGVAVLRLSAKVDQGSMNPRVIRLQGGDRINRIPDAAVAEIECHSETAAAEWEQKLLKEARTRRLEVSVSTSGSTVRLSVRGVPAHASTPDLGQNAVIHLASLLTTQPIANQSLWRALAT
ncbi:MAG: Sapep family Mn(2+)-dependent dipeptidase, partial [Alicyclobacillus sp.]|nr:Sapep family Mn(2+)-dependent dipeptidase [Alicyclobacillus sp.]